MSVLMWLVLLVSIPVDLLVLLVALLFVAGLRGQRRRRNQSTAPIISSPDAEPAP